ncbi:hypothetical protein ACSQ67_021672 [Phaseolus vulgaris]
MASHLNLFFFPSHFSLSLSISFNSWNHHDHPHSATSSPWVFKIAGAEVEANTAEINEGELVLDGGFLIPQTNTFGHIFRAYNDAESERHEGVENFYRKNHTYQSLDFVKKLREEYAKLNKVEMSIWECCELLNEVVDESDPDLDEPQIEHLLQTAEAIRKDYPDEDWLHLTGLIHGSFYILMQF